MRQLRVRIIVAIACIFVTALLIGFFSGRTWAQSTTINLAVAPGTTSANCPAVVTGQTIWCFAGNAVIYVSNNGAAYVQYAPPSAGGVTSVVVNGGTPQIGAVTLTIPTKATTTATTTIQ